MNVWTWMLVALAVLMGFAVTWWVVFDLVYGDRDATCLLEVQDHQMGPVRIMELRLAPKLPKARGHDYVTLGDVIRTRIVDAIDHPDVHLPALRREAWLGHLQSRWVWHGFWLLVYGLSKRFRAAQEAEAARHEQMDYPWITVR